MNRDRGRAEVLALLQRTHGIGVRPAGAPGWVLARLDRTLDALEAQAGSLEEAVELLRRQPDQLSQLADSLRVGETRFFRDPAQWQALTEQVLPRFAQRERVRGLSVGCSTGEEAWTLAMALRDANLSSPSVVGVDRSEAAIEQARRGIYPAEGAAHLPDGWAKRYARLSDDDLEIGDELRSLTRFLVRDAMLGPPPGHYEVILCKNLLIYFGDDAAAQLVDALLRGLDSEGVLMVARSETPRLRALGHRAVPLASGVTAFVR